MRQNQVGLIEFLAATALACLVMLLIYPAEGMSAAIRGISIWWDILFPALFPFFVISEMLLGFGIVHFFGTIMDPIMRPFFRIPGIGGFVVAMGFASGYPVGARLTSQLWDQGLITRDEGERLVAFTTTSDPIFLIGAVSVGFFHDVELALILALSHYGSALCIGFLMRFHGKACPLEVITVKEKNHSLLHRSFEAMHAARLKDGRPLGLLLQQAILSSIPLIFVIGGLVVFFSVVIEFLTISHILGILSRYLHVLLGYLHIPKALSPAFVNGYFEVTLGVKSAAQIGGNIPLIYKVAAASFLLSWGGLSVHAQVVSLLHRTKMRYFPFLVARSVHSVLAAVFVMLFWDTLQ